MVQGFASKVCRRILVTVHKGLTECVFDAITFSAGQHQQNLQKFCQEAVVWKRLTHPNVLPLLGVTINPFQLISSWMPGGDLPEYIKLNPDADRRRLVRLPPVVFILCSPRYQISDVANGLCYLHSCDVIHGVIAGVRERSKSCFTTMLTPS